MVCSIRQASRSAVWGSTPGCDKLAGKEAVFLIGLLGYLSAYIGQAQRSPHPCHDSIRAIMNLSCPSS